MNKAFKNSKEIVLDNNYKIISDADSGVILVFETTKVNKKKETVSFEELFHYPRIAQALRYYSSKLINNSKSIEQAIEISESVYARIESLDKEFKQFN